jgi:putative transposase
MMKEPAAKCRKICLYPNERQKEVLRRWFGTVRWTYNRCVEAVKKGMVKATKKDLRAYTLNKEALEGGEFAWALETPYDVRDEAMNDLLKAYKSNFARRKKKADHKFVVHFRSRKRCSSESIVIHAKHWSQRHEGVFHVKSFGEEALRSAEPIPDEARQYDCRLQRTKLGDYYLCVPLPLAPVVENQDHHVPMNRVAAIDPGVRCFATIYDPSGTVIEWGRNDIGHIYRLCARMDSLYSRAQCESNRKRRSRMRCAALRMAQRIRNLTIELHCKLAKFLCEQYNAVLLPTFPTQRMILRKARRIGSRTARAMVTLRHYAFQQRLLSKAREYPWCEILLVDEAYTSKTCTRCGAIHAKLGSAKLFACTRCGLRIDRDVNGARSILLRNSSLVNFGWRGAPHPAKDAMR